MSCLDRELSLSRHMRTVWTSLIRVKSVRICLLHAVATTTPPQLHAVGTTTPPSSTPSERQPHSGPSPSTAGSFLQSTDPGTGRPSVQEDSMDYRKLPTGLADGCPTGASIRRRPAIFLGRCASPDPSEAYGRDLSPQRDKVPVSPQDQSSAGQAGR